MSQATDHCVPFEPSVSWRSPQRSSGPIGVNPARRGVNLWALEACRESNSGKWQLRGVQFVHDDPNDRKPSPLWLKTHVCVDQQDSSGTELIHT
eukprot:2420488-Amphidinium_carterae.6